MASIFRGPVQGDAEFHAHRLHDVAAGVIDVAAAAAGNVRTRTDARGLTATYTYDALNRLTGITYPAAGENVTFTYDTASGSPACTNGLGRLCQVLDAGGSTRYVYDARGNVVQTVRIELGVTYTTNYTYTAADRLATVTAPTGKTFTVARDAVGRVQSVSGTVAGQPLALVANTQYTADGQVRQQTFGNGIQQATAFDADGRASGATLTESAGLDQDIPLPAWALVLLAGGLLAIVAGRRQPQRLVVFAVLAVACTTWTLLPIAYAFDTHRQYDAAGNLTRRTNAAGTTAFTYDPLNRLTSEAGPARTQSFAFDANGNRLGDESGSYTTVPNSNRYATIRGAAASYDAAGNLTALATGSPPTTKTFTYNQAGRLAEVRQGATLLATYTYNAFGQRTRKALTAAGAQALGLPASPLTIVYHYDLAGNLLAETTGTGTPIRTYAWREAATGLLAAQALDTPIAQLEHANNVALGGSNGSGSEFVLYFTVDELATPREARNQAGQVLWRWASDAFGATLPAEDVDGNGQRTVVNLRFPGQYADREAGLHYNWHRTYDAESGRYLESDPIGLEGGVNTYGYVKGNPVSRIDPLGLADLVYNNTTRTLTIVSAGGAEAFYPATNNAASTSRGPWPQGVFPYERHNSHPNRTAASDTGTDFFGFTVPGRTDMGVHAGRQGICDLANRCGFEHATLGCIRTTPEAMDAIRQLHLGGDPIRRLTVIR